MLTPGKSIVIYEDSFTTFYSCLPSKSGMITTAGGCSNRYFILDTGCSPMQYSNLHMTAKVQMALSEFEKQRVTRIFSSYCEAKAPHHVSDQFRVEFEVRGQEIKLFESRPYELDRSKWISHKIARFRKDGDSNVWQLFYSDRKGRWRLFEPYPAEKDIEKLLDEVEKDSSGSFWG